MPGAETTFVCSVEVSKTKGFTFKLQNDSGKITQTVTLDGTTLVLKVAGEKSTSTYTQTCEQVELKIVGENDTSTVTQTASAVSVNCKSFSVDAETVSVKSSKTTQHEASETLTIKSTKDMSVTSSAKLSLTSTEDMSLTSSAKLSQVATGDASLKGNSTTLEANLKLAGKGGLDVALSATKLSVNGEAKIDINSPMTTLGDTLTTVKGTNGQGRGRLGEARLSPCRRTPSNARF